MFRKFCYILQFLDRVGEIQEEQARLEQAKLEAELAKQKKRESRKSKTSASPQIQAK